MIGVVGLPQDVRPLDDIGHRRGVDLITAAAALQALPVATLVLDPRHDDIPIVFVNAAAVALTGFRGDDLLGQNDRILIGVETDPVALARFRAAIAAAKPLEIEIRLHRKDGVGFWARVIVAPLRGEDGSVEHIVVNIIDLTVERNCIDALDDHNRVLTMMGEGLARQNRILTKQCEALQRQLEGGHTPPAAPRSTH